MADDVFHCTNEVLRTKLYSANMAWEAVTSMESERCCFAAAVYRNGNAVAGDSSFKTSRPKSAEF